jgi:hypothetical protein
MKRVVSLGLIALAACSDALEQTTTAGQVIAVADAQSSTASLVSAARLAVSHDIPLPADPTGSVSSLGSVLIVPIAGGVAVIDLTSSTSTVTGTVPLVGGGFPRGTAVQDDHVAWVTYEMPSQMPHRYAVWRINYRTGDTASVGFDADPKAVALAAGNIFVVSVGVGDTSWLTVMDTSLTTGSPRISIVDSIPLTGLNAGGMTLGRDGFLYVVSSGPLTNGGATEGRLSIVDPVLRAEVAVVNGLGNGLGPPVYHASGRVLIPSVSGILEVSPATRSVTLGPGRGAKPAGDSPNLLVIDERGRVYAVVDHCADAGQPPGAVHVLAPPPDYELRTTIPIGSCPVGAAAAIMP